MEYIKASEQYKFEQNIIENAGVPAEVLMEVASRAVCQQMLKMLTEEDNLLIIAGTGNNGADAIAVGRYLHNEGFNVNIYLAGEQEAQTSLNQLQVNIAKYYGVYFLSELSQTIWDDATIIVDGLFGIGLSRPIEGEVSNLVKSINESIAYVFAIDVPSGISSESGEKLGICVQANETITFGFSKNGMQKAELNQYFGKVIIDDIGFFIQIDAKKNAATQQ